MPTGYQQPQPQDPTPPARPSHHAENQSPGTGGEGENGGRWRGEEALEIPEKT